VGGAWLLMKNGRTWNWHVEYNEKRQSQKLEGDQIHLEPSLSKVVGDAPYGMVAPMFVYIQVGLDVHK